MKEERCVDCDALTGKAGQGDGSLYADSGRGPYCCDCYNSARVDELETQCATKDRQLVDLQKQVDNLTEYMLKGVAFRDELQAKIKQLEEAISCSSENCSELGRFHDGDCSECPQGIIRRRAKEG
jgi:hypothetical protein